MIHRHRDEQLEVSVSTSDQSITLRTGPSRFDMRSNPSPTSPGARAYPQIALFAAHGPLLWLAGNTRNQPEYMDVAVVTILLCAVAIGLYKMLSKILRSAWVALSLVSIGLVVFWNWQSLLLPIGDLPAPLTSVVATLLLVAMSWVNATRWLFRTALLASGTTVVAIGALLTAMRVTDGRPTNIDISPQRLEVADQGVLPDIYVLILDGYARADVLRDRYGYDNGQFIQFLEDSGFQVADHATANYSITHFSLASMLAMDYVIDENTPVTAGDLDALRSILEGDNTVMRTLASVGYRTVRGSQAWWGTECAENEVCLDNPALSRTAHELLEGTPVAPFTYPAEGDVGTVLTLQRLNQLRNWDPDAYRVNDSPLFVFLHMPIPHPPMFLDSNCDPGPSESGAGRVVNDIPPFEGAELQIRLQRYVDQIECANRVAKALLDAVQPDDVVVIVSDHGPDSYSQLKVSPTGWQPPAVWERMSNLMAVRIPEGCESPLPDDATLVNLFRHIFNCTFDIDLDELPMRHFAAPSTKYESPVFALAYPADTHALDADARSAFG